MGRRLQCAELSSLVQTMRGWERAVGALPYVFFPTCRPPLLIVITKGKWEGTRGAGLWFTGVMVSISHSRSLLLGKSLAPWFVKRVVKASSPQKKKEEKKKRDGKSMNIPLQSMGDSPLNHLRRWENRALMIQTQTWDLILSLTPFGKLLRSQSGPD